MLVTGASGLIGSILLENLATDYELSGIDAARARRPEVRVADMRRLRAIEDSFRNQDAVVDLAADPSATASWKQVYENNLPATFNALEAARRAGVKRFVFASSNHVTGGYERDHPYSAIAAGDYEGLDPGRIEPITSAHPIRPDGPYGIGKAFGEAAGRYFADEFGLSVICLRIGTVNESGRPTEPRDFATLLTHDDLVRLVRCCLGAPPDLRFGVFYGVSRNRWRYWDIADAGAQLGYDPRDDAEAWR